MKARRYIPFTQQPFCCVPTCIQMILHRRQLPLLTQEDIGIALGLTVPQDYAAVLPKARTGPRPKAGWGTRVGSSDYSLNEVFKGSNLPLNERYVPPSDIHSLTAELSILLGQDTDVIVCFNYGHLYASDADYGHVSLVDSVDNDGIVLVDPEQRVPKFRQVSQALLKEAIDLHGEENRAGLWCISAVESER